MMTDQAILEAMSTAFVCLDADGVIVRSNRAFATMVGSALDNLVGASMAMAADYESNRAYFDALALTRADGVTRRVRNAGADFHAVFDNVITRAGDLLIVEVTDVSREVRERDRRTELEAAREVVWRRTEEHILAFDLAGGSLLVSDSVRDRWPIAQLEAAMRDGTMLDALSNPHQWSDPWIDETSLFDGRVERAIAEVYTTGIEQRHRTRVPLAPGVARFFDTQLVPWEVEGAVRGVIIVAHDLTQQLRAQRRSIFAAEAINQVLEHLPVEVWDFDLSRGLVTPLFGQGLPGGDHADETVDPQPMSVILSRLAPDAGAKMWGALDRLATEDSVSVQVQSADGGRRLQASFRFVPGAEFDRRRRAVVVITDVTSEVVKAEAESRLGHANHVMRFAQGVAHDFGNVAQVVGGYSEILLQHPGPEIVEMAARSLASAAQRGVAVSRRIAKIAEVQQAVNAPIDLSAVVGSSLPRLRQLVGGRVTVTADCPPGLVGIAEEEQVVSALENLCENAAEAMSRAGTIHIAVAPVASSGGRFVEIAVADDGPGIPDHLLGSVFDPFVTGRPDSGTGLGLYLIQEYLYSAGGTVEVESSPQGATFRLRFPAP